MRSKLQRSVSIHDIARKAGVSHGTVSRALRDSPLISKKLRDKLQQLAGDMGYVPNEVAQNLKQRRTHTVGLVVTSIEDPFLGLVVRGVNEVVHQSHMSLLLSISDNDPQNEIASIEGFHRRRVDAIIDAAGKLGDSYAKRLANSKVPTVLINHQADLPCGLLHSIEVDDYSGARQALGHLTELGHCAIGYLGAGNRPRSNRNRLAGYEEGLRTAGIHPKKEWVTMASPDNKYHSDDVSDGFSLLPELLASRITAVFCYNDMIAIGVLQACRNKGIAVPQQLSVMGFDDIDVAQYMLPPLTTTYQPKLRLGRMAMEMVLDLLNERSVENHLLPTELRQRGTTTGLAPYNSG